MSDETFIEGSQSRSVSLSPALWDMVEMVADTDGIDRSKLVKKVLIADFTSRGLMNAPSETVEVFEMVKEALGLGLPVKQLIQDAIRGEAA